MPRRRCDGVATQTRLAPSTALARSLVARTVGAMRTPGRKRGFSCSRMIDEATSASYAHTVTAWPLRASRSASAVPHAPAPMTAVCKTTPSSGISPPEAMLLSTAKPRDVGAMRPEHEQRDQGAHDEERRARPERDEQQAGKNDGGDQAAEGDVARSQYDADEHREGDRHRDGSQGEEHTRRCRNPLSASSKSEKDRSHVPENGGNAAGDRPDDRITRAGDARRKIEHG